MPDDDKLHQQAAPSEGARSQPRSVGDEREDAAYDECLDAQYREHLEAEQRIDAAYRRLDDIINELSSLRIALNSGYPPEHVLDRINMFWAVRLGMARHAHARMRLLELVDESGNLLPSSVALHPKMHSWEQLSDEDHALFAALDEFEALAMRDDEGRDFSDSPDPQQRTEQTALLGTDPYLASSFRSWLLRGAEYETGENLFGDMKRVDDPRCDRAAFVVHNFQKQFPEYGTPLTPADVQTLIDAWARKGRPRARGTKEPKKWPAAVSVFKRIGLGAITPESLATEWAAWKTSTRRVDPGTRINSRS